MSLNLFVFKRFIFLFFFVSFYIVLTDKSLAQIWNARIYPKNKNFVEVTLDLRGLEPYIEWRDVTVYLVFLNHSKHLIKDVKFDFTDSNLRALYGGKVYKRYFSNPYLSSDSVKPDPNLKESLVHSTVILGTHETDPNINNLVPMSPYTDGNFGK